MKNIIIINLLIIFLSFLIGIYFYPRMPEMMASHWNSQGQVDGYISRFWGLFLMPLISFGLLLLLLFVPKLDPLKTNVKKFRKYYDFFILILILFLFYLYFLTVLWNLGIRFDMNLVLPPAFGALFFYIGILIEKAKRNWFIGIRTPWTLSSDEVWRKTHKIGGKMFKTAGLLAVFGIFFNDYALYFSIIPVIFTAVYTVIYSYLEYKKLS